MPLEEQVENAGTAEAENAERHEEDLLEEVTREEYVSQFVDRYLEEKAFQKKVHKFLDLGKISLAGLSVAKVLAPSLYRTVAKKNARKAANEIYRMRLEAQELEREHLRLEETKEKFVATSEKYTEISALTEQKKAAYEEAQLDLQESEKAAQEGVAERIERIKKEREERMERIQEELNERELVESTVRSYVKNSDLVECRDDGEIVFNDERAVDELSNMLLDNILEGIRRDEGVGMAAKVSAIFEGEITGLRPAEAPFEQAMANWQASAIYAATIGGGEPAYPFIMVPEFSGAGKVPVGIYQALDCSGSMRRNNRMNIATDTSLAIYALTKRANNQNKHGVILFNQDIQHIDPIRLSRRIKANGGTGTYKALDWLYEECKANEPAIACLVSDGMPEGTDAIPHAIESAKKFQTLKETRLSIFLIEGDERTIDITRQIGRAAGRNTTVIPVENYQLPGGMVKSVAESLGRLYNIGDF